VPPRAGTVAFPRLTAGVPVDRFAAELAAEAGVLVFPAEVFGFPGNHFRLGFGRADLPEALASLERFIRGRMPCGPGPSGVAVRAAGSKVRAARDPARDSRREPARDPAGSL
jgi:hypothetical protein